MEEVRYDYIIVGAGSAGCVLANRLTENPAVNVLVLEFGGNDNSILIRMPTALQYPMSTRRFNWGYWTEPEPYLNGRRMDLSRGKAIGGSSSINGMIYVRGNAGDYEKWEELGAKGWGYRDCLPYFRKSETCAYGEDMYRGGRGPIHTNNGNGMINPLYTAFIRAGAEAGYGMTQDYNGYRQEGMCRMDMTVRDGVRCSTALAYLKPVMKRRNLTVVTQALVRRIVLQGRTATGVEYIKDGKTQTMLVGREVILSAGSIGSPHILQLSGIGPSAVLKKAGIEVRHELPGVGENFQDHLESVIQYEIKDPSISYNRRLNLASRFLIGARWVLFKSGLGATNHFESTGFIRTHAGRKYPNVQFHFLPLNIRYDAKGGADIPGYQIHFGVNNPFSRGWVRARTPNPQDHPELQVNYMSDPRDVEEYRTAFRLTREIGLQPAFDPYRLREIDPGEEVQSDDEIDGWVRENVEVAYHPTCSCKMGSADDPMAVVSRDCRVRGIDGLRVVDSSIFPTVPNGNTNGPTIMLAEKAADIIRGLPPLPPSPAPFWVAPQWETRQRESEPVRKYVEA